jgi:hypothetical protein
MKVYGIRPERIDYRKDIYIAAKLISRSEYFKERELLVVNKDDKVMGCVSQAHLIYLLLDGKLYLEQPYLLSVKIAHENSLYRDEILKTAKNGRSLFIVEEGTKLGRFRKNLKIGSVLAEIPVTNAFEMGFDLKIPKDYAGSLYAFEVLDKKKR